MISALEKHRPVVTNNWEPYSTDRFDVFYGLVPSTLGTLAGLAQRSLTARIGDLFFRLLKGAGEGAEGCLAMLQDALVATDAPRIIRLQAIVVMAWKRSSVRSRSGPPINQQLTASLLSSLVSSGVKS
jgi:hypothetical protein